MPLRVEHIDMLRSVSLFVETPAETLAEVAALLDDITAHAGETIIEKGAPGDCLYILVAGRARAHDGDRVLNDLGPGDVFGEMAVLDPEPRSASVTAVEESHLFRLSGAALEHLMDARPEVARSIIRILVQRLRGRVRDMAEDFLYMQQFARVTSAAAAVEAGIYRPESLDEVARRSDALGQLARVFQRMEREVYAREQRLKQEVQQLRIEIDEVKQAQDVARIVESDAFRALQERAQERRNRRKGPSPGPG